ncbi:MAG TPA: hypothetical protein VMT61_04180 [Candidatus Binataceae bacterium]|nr:hypothetical protein [Candidatus Binataceae bacterium]
MKKGSNAANCITSGSKIIQADGFNCLSADSSGTNTEATTLLPQAIADVATFVTAVKAATRTQVIQNKIVVAANDSQLIVDSQTGLNIITVPSITLKTNSVLTLVGASNLTDQVVLVVAGNLKIGADTFLAPASSGPSFPMPALFTSC